MPGTVLEMSIVLRRKTAFQDNKEKCPRCSYVNSGVSPVCGLGGVVSFADLSANIDI